VTLELNRLTQAVREMAQALALQQRDLTRLVEQAQAWLAEFSDQGSALRDAAAQVGAAIPAAEPLDAAVPLPILPERFTVIGADGSQVQPDRHGMALYYLVNVGSLVYRQGSGETPAARSVPDLRFRVEDLYEGALLVAGNLLDVRRDWAEIHELADLVEAEPVGPTLALVDGTLLLWVLENLPAEGRKEKVDRYLVELERIRRRGAAVAAFTSRPRYGEVGKLLHLACMDGKVERVRGEPNPLERVPDRAIFSFLPAGARSALFASSSTISRTYYGSDHQVHFFYVNVAAQDEEPVVARVEVPAWVVRGGRGESGDRGESPLLELVHGGVVAQSRIGGGFPYVLARADELAYVSGPERERLGEMLATALMAVGLSPAASPKADYKSLTRRGRRRPELARGRW
jgi:hypothetical protein